MVKLRTIRQCYAYLKEQDKDTAITLYFIRTLCSSGKVEFINAGNKFLINLDSLLKVLKNEY